MATTTATTKPPGLGLRIRDATEADVPAIAAIFFDAFGDGVISRLMYPRGHSDPLVLAKFAESVLAPPEQPPLAKRPLPVEHVVMVAEVLAGEDPEDLEEKGGGQEGQGEIIAFAKWRVVKEALTEDEWDVEIKAKTAEEVGPWMDVDFTNAFQTDVKSMMKGYQKGEPLIYLDLLACKTARHRSGAGSALVRWGVDKADREGKVAYLEASPVGYPLYRRFGFEDLDVQDLGIAEEPWGAVQREGEDWGANVAVALAGPKPDGAYRSVLMKRIPKKEE